MGLIGAKVARVGNVNNTSDANLVFSTSFQTMPIFLEGLSDVFVSALGSKSLTIRHGLNFVPFVLAWFIDPRVVGKWQWIPTTGGNSLGGFMDILDIRVDTQNVVFPITNGDAAETITIHYVIFNFPVALSI